MIKTIRKVFFVWDYDKEETWLNEMSAKGLLLHSVGFCKYAFEEGEPGKYIYRLELLNPRLSREEKALYISSVEDTGAEHIASLFRWVYFRKEDDGNGFEIFSDLDSRIAHTNRILSLLGIITGVNTINGLNILRMSYTNSHYTLTAPLIIFACCLITGYGFFRISRKKQKMVKEKAQRE